MYFRLILANCSIQLLELLWGLLCSPAEPSVRVLMVKGCWFGERGRNSERPRNLENNHCIILRFLQWLANVSKLCFQITLKP